MADVSFKKTYKEYLKLLFCNFQIKNTRLVNKTFVNIQNSTKLSNSTVVVEMHLEYIFISNIIDRLILNILGIVVSLYALRVELKKEADPSYVAACDFNDNMSCSKVLTSKYSKGFGFMGTLVGNDHFLNQRNCNLGILFYILQIILAFLPYPALCSKLLFYSSIVGGIGSFYLAFILFIILKDVCVVCIATYIVNGALFYLNYSLYQNYSD